MPSFPRLFISSLATLPELRLAAALTMSIIMLTGAPAQAGVPNLFFLFDEEAQPGTQVDSSGGAFLIKFPPSSQRDTTAPRFGSGSLKIDRIKPEAGVGNGFEVLLTDSQLDGFREHITQMTVSTWINATGVTPFVIFRRIPGATYYPGLPVLLSRGGEGSSLLFDDR